MKYAFFPGCDVPRKSTPELYLSSVGACQKLGIELEELKWAPCTGSGIVQSKDLTLGDTLDASILAMAEIEGLPLMTVCSTCQGVLAQANKRFREKPDYLAEINKTLLEGGLEYKGTTEVKHFLWVLQEDLGLDKLKSMVVRPLKGVQVAPFYGCYIVRPSEALGYEEHPERAHALEDVIDALGGEVVEYGGMKKCCGYPIVGDNERNSNEMVANHALEAKEKGAQLMVTPCPLCHMNLDGTQPPAAEQRGTRIGMPVFHLPQLVGLAIGMEPSDLGFDRHTVSTEGIVASVKT
jgi:succinate dehydrogenase / fumarate reductase cytochrome b subunit